MDENKRPVTYCMRGVRGPRKAADTMPHDMGDPGNILYCTFET